MITSDLIEYINGELNDNVSKDLIISTLLEAGWKKEDIEEGFSNIKEKENKEIKKSVDPYRELPEEGDPIALKLKAELEDKNTGTITPTGGAQILDLSNLNKALVDVPIIDTTVIKNPIIEPVVEKPVVETPVVEEPVVETPPVPFTMPAIIIPPHEEKVEVNKVWTPTTIKPVEEKKEIEEIKKTETITMEPLIVVTPEEDKKENTQTQTELIPNLNKAPSIASMGGVISGPQKLAPTTGAPVVNNMSGIVLNKAILSSYSKDIISATKKEEEVIPASPNKKKNFIKLGIFIIILAFIGGMIFAFVEGYIKIPGSNWSFLVVKKDPKTLILNASASIAKLKSFKTETNINITSPSLSNITTGLSSGDVVTSKDTDSISIKALGLINHVNDKSIIDYEFNLKSSILENEINTNLKYNNGDLYFSVPDLKGILGKDAPDPTTISTTRDQLGLITKELSSETQDLIKKLDIYNIIGTEVPLYIKTEIAGAMKEFINTFEYVDKGEELIHGINTTHYEVTVTRPATKKFLSSLATLFVPQLSSEEKNTLDEAIGASSISSFEVWVGKKDDNLYQIKFILNSPLSKVLRLNDSGIAGNEVKLDWMTTFYDLDVENNIVIPTGEVNMDGFIKNIQNIKIKNSVSSFKSQSTLFKNAVGSYGKSNTLGSCTTPVSGSLFSPLGHPKGADTAVSSISTTMNSLLAITKNEGLCFSSSKAWALAMPINTTPVSYYCIDNTGTTTTLLGPITNPVCSNPVIPVAPSSATPTIEKTTNMPVVPPTPPVTN